MMYLCACILRGIRGRETSYSLNLNKCLFELCILDKIYVLRFLYD